MSPVGKVFDLGNMPDEIGEDWHDVVVKECSKRENDHGFYVFTLLLVDSEGRELVSNLRLPNHSNINYIPSAGSRSAGLAFQAAANCLGINGDPNTFCVRSIGCECAVLVRSGLVVRWGNKGQRKCSKFARRKGNW